MIDAPPKETEMEFRSLHSNIKTTTARKKTFSSNDIAEMTDEGDN